MRKDPIHGYRRMHEGLDIAAPVGSSIYPMGDGQVIYSGYKAGYGKTIIIKHGRTVITQYSHLKDILIKPGQDVSKNTVIGLVGNSGRSTGPHLHLEVTLSGNKVDPATFLAGIVASKIEVASRSKIISSAAPVMPVKLEKVTYQDYLQSFDGLYGLRAPDRTN
jgi:murein DD-endopeptidase MepM/ murein hydrolase activator NlpD